MSKQKTQTGSTSESTAAATPRWPKIVASPVTWESGATAYRLGRTLGTTYRPRRLAVDPVQRADLW